ncbi:MAG TPA: preprotein translocase subunit SecE [Polyangiaceae bacterium]|nr:preprotein translocase subunit SecE [Polyangiaceae bacterium]
MATESDQNQKPKADDLSHEAEEAIAADAQVVPGLAGTVVHDSSSPDEDAPATVQLGAKRYVHAAFFAAGILVAFLSSKILHAVWSELADWPAAVRAIPQLVSYPEEERDGFTLGIGALIGAISVIQVYRKAAIRGWADDVAGELAKVSWPNRDTVVNGTLVVVIASAFATVYVAILDKFWSFLTTLVYGA